MIEPMKDSIGQALLLGDWALAIPQAERTVRIENQDGRLDDAIASKQA